ncbi:MAG: mRNA surveillance protein pelota [Crenarchaeota archaeon]|nr:mRNA surveillance protein pelota [Thermoproteota archaeon]
MKILGFDEKRGELRLRVESMDDVWLLSLIIRPGDYVRALTVREIKFGERGSGRSSRVAMTLTIRVRSVEFQPFTNKIRIRGIVIEGPERFGVKGKHHTISIGVGNELTIIREDGWPGYVLRKIRDAGLRVKVVVVAVDYDDYAIAIVRGQGVRVVVEGSLHLPGKDDPSWEEGLRKAVTVIAKQAVQAMKSAEADAVVVVGPGRVKNLVAEKIRELAGPGARIIVESASMGGEAGVREAIRRGLIERVAKEAEITAAERLLDELNLLIVKNPEQVAYGLPDVEYAVECNAVRELLVLDTLLYSEDPEKRRRVEELLEKADKRAARIRIVPVHSPAGMRLKSLGGIAAILRYPLPRQRTETLGSRDLEG